MQNTDFNECHCRDCREMTEIRGIPETHEHTYQCFCGQRLYSQMGLNEIIKNHLLTKKHENLLNRREKYHICELCEQPIDKNNKNAIENHMNKKHRRHGIETCYLNGKIISKERFDELADQFLIWG